MMEDAQQHFPGLTNRDVEKRLEAIFSNTEWMFGIKNDIPGPNLKPIIEHLHGGLHEMLDIAYDALEQIGYTKEEVDGQHLLRYENASSGMLVAGLKNPEDLLDEKLIDMGNSKGAVVTRTQFHALQEKQYQPHLVDTEQAKYKPITLSSITLPYHENQKHANQLNRESLIDAHDLLGNNPFAMSDYRLDLIGKFEERYDLPKIQPGIKPQRWENTDKLHVAFLHAGDKQPKGTKALKERLTSSMSDMLDIVRMPTQEELLADGTINYLDGADLVFMMPSKDASDLDNARLLHAATVDIQTRPEDKEKILVVMNPKKDGKGVFDPALEVIRHNFNNGLKYGQAEIRHLVEFDPKELSQLEQIDALFRKIEAITIEAAERKKHLFAAKYEKPKSKQQTLKPIPQDKFTVFVAGGAANEYPAYKEPANRFGRFIEKMGWVLVTGAGEREGPMGAVHSGFLESYLNGLFDNNKLFCNNKYAEILTEHIHDSVDKLIRVKNLQGKYADSYRRDIEDAAFTNINAEYLLVHAPEVLKEMIEPSSEFMRDVLPSLKRERRMFGYSMDYLLKTEGSGEPPFGMNYQEAGNMQRRMHEMTKAAVHVYFPGSQGTTQELLESVHLNIEALEHGEQPKDIIVFNPRSYLGTHIFDVDLAYINESLLAKGLTQKDIHLQVVDRIDALESKVKASYKSWQNDKKQPDRVAGINQGARISL